MRRLIVLAALLPPPAIADPPRVEAARIEGGRVHVTLSHPDSGWDHYADGWEVVTEDGAVVARRELAHPHVDEQPLTRSAPWDDNLLPRKLAALFVRARCSVDGWGAALFPIGSR